MITIGMLTGSGLSGTVKKMLHVPTLRLFVVKEQVFLFWLFNSLANS